MTDEGTDSGDVLAELEREFASLGRTDEVEHSDEDTQRHSHSGSSNATSSPSNRYEELEQLFKLKEIGAISGEEYEQEKRVLLRSTGSSDEMESPPDEDVETVARGEEESSGATSASSSISTSNPRTEEEDYSGESEYSGKTPEPDQALPDAPTHDDDDPSSSGQQQWSDEDLPEVPCSEFAELTAFQRDLLILVEGLEMQKGLAIKEELSKYYKEEVNHGRLYPNLDSLVDAELIEKVAINKRSNGYVLTDRGKAHILRRRRWENRQ